MEKSLQMCRYNQFCISSDRGADKYGSNIAGRRFVILL